MADPKFLTYGPANIDSVLAATRSAFIRFKNELEDQVFLKNPLLNWLEQKAKVTKNGGASLLVRLHHTKNSTAKAYSRYETLDTTPQENFTLGQYKWARYAASISLAGDEEAMNGGPEQIASLAKDKSFDAIGSLREEINIDMHAASQVSKKISTLVTLVDQTSTVADVNSSTNSWWQAQQVASGSFSAQGPADMRNLYNTISVQGQGGGAPDFILTTQAILEFYEALEEPKQRYENIKLADNGFQNFKFKGATMTFDPNTAAGIMYFLCSECLKYVVHSKRNFSMSKFKEPVAQDARVAQVFWMGQLLTGSRRKQGKLTGITA